MSVNENKFILTAKEMPKAWYNITADMPNKPPVALNPATLEPAKPEDFSAIFPPELIAQELSEERYIEIPEEVQEYFNMYRATPLIRATRLEKALDTPAKIYFKDEGRTLAGSHKTNTAIAQAYYNKKAGIKRLTTETGAGQWGCALAMAGNFFDLDVKVYMVQVSYFQKPYRRNFIELYGGNVVPSPTMDTQAGRDALAKDPDCKGSLGIAIGEAVEDALGRDDTSYALGSVLNHVALHQTIIGEEAKLQLAKDDVYPDVVVACVGGGSNFAGTAFPFIKDKITKNQNVRCVAIEPTACPSLTKGTKAYDYGDTAKLTPALNMHTLGHEFMPPGIHAGGLRYHGTNTLLSQLYEDNFIEAKSVNQTDIFKSAILFAKTEGIVPAPESAHAIKGAIDEALAAKEAGEERNILFCLSGHGSFDMAAYEKFLKGELKDVKYGDEVIKESLKHLPEIK